MKINVKRIASDLHRKNRDLIEEFKFKCILAFYINYDMSKTFLENLKFNMEKLVDTDFYELRISVGNEYRVILFTIDHENFIEAEQILLLNGFMKKSTKDYKKEIQKAEQILNSLQQ